MFILLLALLRDESGAMGIMGRRRGRHFLGSQSAAKPTSGYLLQEDGTSHFLLEDGSGAIILEG